MNKLSYRGLILSLAITWSISCLFLGWIGALGWGAELVRLLGKLYIGYTPSFIGGIIGAIWAFADGAAAGLIITFFYNICSCKKEDKMENE